MELWQKVTHIINPAGGLAYHAKARRYSSHLWQPLRTKLLAFLNDWSPESDTLVLISPSGGYSLSTSFLERFKRVIAVDPDPVAKKVFLGRHNHENINWIARDVFGIQRRRITGLPLEALLQEHPAATVLFCNVLGQLPLLAPGSFSCPVIATEWKHRLNEILSGHTWGSFHDLFSAAGQLSPKDLTQDFHMPPDLGMVLQKLGGTTEFTDHLTTSLFSQQSLQRKYFFWQITPERFHIVEAVHSI